MQGARYDAMGRGYRAVRRPDPRLAAPIWGALSDARTVVNVGAGTGSYEPPDLQVVAVEPSRVMLSQRARDAAPALQATAEALPLRDHSVDAALAVFTIQHWSDVERGLGELVRVARRRVVLLTMDVDVLAETWMVRDYLPETLDAHAAGFPSMRWLLGALPRARSRAIPVPNDCSDGFMAAFWGRPEAYLDADVRAAGSVWHQLSPAVVTRGLGRLRDDLATGEWDRRRGHLRTAPSLDVGVRLVYGETGR